MYLFSSGVAYIVPAGFAYEFSDSSLRGLEEMDFFRDLHVNGGRVFMPARCNRSNYANYAVEGPGKITTRARIPANI